eukprot:scaffold94618_cov54-Attheya_sp.AAC.1
MLKEFIKRPGRQTRNTHADFALDLINRWSEYSCIMDYMSKVDTTELKQAELGNVNRGRSNGNGMETDLVETDVAETEVQFKMIRHAFSFEKYGTHWNTVCGNDPSVGVNHPYCELLECQTKALKKS